MPPTQEAIRLRQAKMAIDKLKKIRHQEKVISKRQKATASDAALMKTLKKSRFSSEDGVVGPESVKIKKEKEPVKIKKEKEPVKIKKEKEPVKIKKEKEPVSLEPETERSSVSLNGHGKVAHTRGTMEVDAFNAYFDVVPSSTASRKSTKTKKSCVDASRSLGPGGSPFNLFCSPAAQEIPVFDNSKKSVLPMPRMDSPFIFPSAVRKVYVNKKKSVSSDVKPDKHEAEGTFLLNSTGLNQSNDIGSPLLNPVGFDELSDGENDANLLNHFSTKSAKTLKKRLNGGEKAVALCKKRPLQVAKKVKKVKKKVQQFEENSEIFNEHPKSSLKIKKFKSAMDGMSDATSQPLSHSTSLKVNKLKALHLKRTCTSKRAHAPMSIKMTSGGVKGPMFTVTEDESLNRNNLKYSEILNGKPSSSTDWPSKSSYSVTTVSEDALPASEDDEADSHHSVSEEEEWSDDVEDKASKSAVNEQNEDGIMLSDVEEAKTAVEEEDIPEDNTKTVNNEEADVTYESLNDSAKVKFHFIDDEVVLHLRHPTTLVFCGNVQLEVLKGAVEISGYLVTPSSGSHAVFSPLKSSLLNLETVSIDESFDSPHPALGSTKLAALVGEANPDDAFLLLNKEDNKLLLYLEQYFKKDFLPRQTKCEIRNTVERANRLLDCSFMPTSKHHFLRKGKMWVEIFANISQKTGCTVLSGGKNVGKSTMLQFLVNRYLSNGKEGVVLIDFDPGQAELTIPGCVSLSVVKKPLLGPNYTHLQDPLKCIYVGDVNVANCVPRYMDACRAIANFWQSEESLRGLPCLVNTMGFTKGIGLSIMVHIISIMNPSSLVQIQSRVNDLNYPELLSVEYVKRIYAISPFRSQLTAHGDKQVVNPSSLNYDLYVEESLANPRPEGYSKLNPRARLSRELVLMSYLSQIASPPDFSLLHAVPYCCPLDSLYLSICHEATPPSVTLSSFNASLVALCRASPKQEEILQANQPGLPSIITGRCLADCVGFGIVRGIDMDSHKIYLLTPVSKDIICTVNCLVLGAVCLPRGVYLRPPKEPTFVPYVAAQRAFLPSYKC